MPRPTVFVVEVDGVQRKLFSVQERKTGDLTIVIKQSTYAVNKAFELNDETKRIVEERFSIHRSMNSPNLIHGLKYTRILQNRSIENSFNYTEALKTRNCFGAIFGRLSGDLSADRYTLTHKNNRIISLGSYDKKYFMLVYLALVSNPNRHFAAPYVTAANIVSTVFSHFRLTILWQFLVTSGDTTSKTAAFVTFHPNQISRASPSMRASMDRQRLGVNEDEALVLFSLLKANFASSLFAESWAGMSEEERNQFKRLAFILKRLDLYVRTGHPFSLEHMAVLRRIMNRGYYYPADVPVL